MATEKIDQFSIQIKCWLCAIAWIVFYGFLIFMVCEGKPDWPTMCMTPGGNIVGLSILLLFGDCGVWGLIIGWAYYVLLTAWSIRAKRKRSFVILFSVLCVSFALNIASCEAIKHGDWKTEKKTFYASQDKSSLLEVKFSAFQN